MQLIEFFLWKNQPCNENNNLITKIGITINHLEPVILYLAIYFFSEKKLPNWVHYIMIVYVLSAVIRDVSRINLYKDSCTNVTNESSPHLHWKWNEGTYSTLFYLLFLAVLIILSINGIYNGYHMSFLITIAYILSYLIYGDKHAIGAMWCFAAAFVPIITPYFYKINL
jgi:hypothetical protein